MEAKPFVPVLLGTARDGRNSEKIAGFIVEQLNEAGFESELVDPKTHLAAPITQRVGKELQGENKWQQTMQKANALFIVTPEYNHGYPGELKLMLDMLFDEYKNKPVVLAGVSVGPWGGTRVVEHILPVLTELGLKPLQKALYFPNSANFEPNSHKENVQLALSSLKSAM